MAGHPPWSEIKRKRALSPYRVECNFTIAVKDIDDLEDRHEQLVERAKVLGFNFEVGSSEPMDSDDVIADSPLDEQLRAG